jgi:hypothetical protein
MGSKSNRVIGERSRDEELVFGLEGREKVGKDEGI